MREIKINYNVHFNLFNNLCAQKLDYHDSIPELAMAVAAVFKLVRAVLVAVAAVI